jgi:uncharacterized protein YvpB
MINKIIIAVLGTFAAFFALASDYAETAAVNTERVEALKKLTAANVTRTETYDGYTVDEYIASYKKHRSIEKRAFSDKFLINAPLVNQYPDLPCGCEIASAVSVIGYNGHNVALTTFADNYITYDTEFWRDDDDNLWGPDPAEVFVGDPFGWGYGCYPNVLADAMDDYFNVIDSPLTAHAVTGLSEEELFELISGGVPVIVWATLDMVNFDYRNPSEWYIKGSGGKNNNPETAKKLTWYKNSHTLVLIGADNDAFYFCDPNDKEDIVAYGRELFMTRYRQAGERAVIVKR